MELREAEKGDIEGYLIARKETLKEYYRFKKIFKIISDKRIKNEFDSLLHSSNRLLLVAKENKKMYGYLIGSFLKNEFEKWGYIDDVFVLKNYQNKNIGRRLIGKFIEISKNKKIKKFRLSVDIKNGKAINFYKKIGFKITEYEMSKKG